jgi:glycosyltransferase involved in cell wall biosynthesis
MKKSADELTISIIIPVYNGGEQFRRCLLSLARTVPAPHEVIVVADGDTDGSWLVAKQLGAKIIRIPQSEGPAKARNIGARAARGDILFFVDADVEIYPDTINQVAIAFEQNPNLGALIGSYDDAPGASNFLSQYKNLFHHYTHQNSLETASTFWGACGAIRRHIFFHVGGFDESYRLPCVEDIELGYRLKQAGYKIKLFPTIQVKHLKRWGIISLIKADFFYRALPWTMLILRHRQFANDLNLRWSSRISVILIYALLGTLVAAWCSSLVWLATLFISVTLLAINYPVYRFFYNKRGMVFAIKTIPWHWLYYIYSGLAFGIGTIRHSLNSTS